MPIVAHNDLPTFARLRAEGQNILESDRALHQDIRELHIGLLNMMPDAALAATGIGGFTNYLCIAFIIGLSAGVQALAARRLGEGRDSETAVPLNGGLILALVLGLPLSVILILLAPAAFPSLNSDPEVIAEGVEDEKHIHLLRQMKCDILQGYYIARPMPAIDFERMLANSCRIIA